MKQKHFNIRINSFLTVITSQSQIWLEIKMKRNTGTSPENGVNISKAVFRPTFAVAKIHNMLVNCS